MNALHAHVKLTDADGTARWTVRYIHRDTPDAKGYARSMKRQRGVVAAEAFACQCATPDTPPVEATP